MIRCPSLFIVGSNDKLCPLAIQFYMSSRVKGSVVEIIKDSSHAPFVERDTEVNNLIANFK